MKKTYITPNTQIIKVETQQMIAESMNKYGDTKSFGSSLSREGDSSFFDDDDED